MGKLYGFTRTVTWCCSFHWVRWSYCSDSGPELTDLTLYNSRKIRYRWLFLLCVIKLAHNSEWTKSASGNILFDTQGLIWIWEQAIWLQPKMNKLRNIFKQTNKLTELPLLSQEVPERVHRLQETTRESYWAEGYFPACCHDVMTVQYAVISIFGKSIYLLKRVTPLSMSEH